MNEGVRLGQETRQRGKSTHASPSEIAALACVYLDEELKRLLMVVRQGKAELDFGRSAIQQLAQQLAAARAELAEKTAALRAVDRETSADFIEAKVAEARESGRAAAAAEVASLRAEIARQRSEVDELRANKRKLREALDRAKKEKR